jgi:hypothetical protein
MQALRKDYKEVAQMNELNMKRILFTDTCNLFEAHDPIAYLVEIPSHITKVQLYALEIKQPGAYRIGGKWGDIMRDGSIKFTLISQGRKSNYTPDTYDEEYQVITGNY